MPEAMAGFPYVNGPLFLDELEDWASRLIANKSTTAKQLADFQDEMISNIYVEPFMPRRIQTRANVVLAA